VLGLNRGKEVYLNLILRAVATLLLLACSTQAQNVTTQHNDIARTGSYTTETILTPSNVNTNTFGKVFYYVVDGYVYAQPLYMASITMGAGTPQAGTQHNVVFVATEHDSVYAFDADSNLGANAKPLWQITLLDTAHGAATGATTEASSDFGYTDIVPEVGITSTPVIDPATNTIYVVGKTKESGTYRYRLHALDITTGGEKFGGPVVLSGSVSGNGSGSSSGTLSFSPTYQLQRPGLLLLNGIVYIAFGATYDVTPTWHGWVFGYNATTLQQTGLWCGSPNGNGSSIWNSGGGLAADVTDPVNHPYGRLFFGTGDRTFNATVPYDNTMSYSISVLRLDLANGAPSMNTNGVQVGDMFAPFDQVTLDKNDQDQGSGGAVILPDPVSGGKHLMVQAGKSGRIYLFDRDNLGGYHPTNTSDPQQKASVGGSVFGLPAYWNGHVYFWPVAGGAGSPLKAFSFANGVLSSVPVSTSAQISSFPGATPSVSSNGANNGIVWTIRNDAFASQGPQILYAHDANNLGNFLYGSDQNAPRDSAGAAVKFTVPTIANGKVYIGGEYQVAVYGLLNGATQAAQPVITPVGQLFHTSMQISMTDSTPGAQIFYTTDGTTPSTASNLYSGPFTISKSQTIQAVAAGSGLLASAVTSETYTLVNQVPTPTFNPVPGDYTSAQSVSITTTWPGSTIYYTTDGTTPTTSSSQYSVPVPISTTTTIKALATAPNLTNSMVASGLYTVATNATSSVNFSNGFPSTGLALVGATTMSGTRLRLTDGGQSEASAAWYPTQVNVQSFSTDFTFQQSLYSQSPRLADGLTFAIQGGGTAALGPAGGGLGYGATVPGAAPGIPRSVAVKFDLFSNAGEGNNSTGLYTNGASPTKPAVTFGGGINLQTSDIFAVHISYDGTTLTMTITDTANVSQTFTTSWPIDIPGTVGAATAYIGFTAGTGHYSSIQDILNWTFVSNSSGQPTTATPVISPSTGTYTAPQTVTIADSTSGSSIFYTLDGSQPSTSSTPYTAAFTVNSTTTVKAIATAPNFLQSVTATSVVTISSQAQTSTPLISPVTGTYSSPQTVNITDATSGSSIFYTLDGSQPTSSSTSYNGAFTVSSTTTVKAIATAPNFTTSNTATSVITIQSGGSPNINFASGFTGTGLQFNGHTHLNGTRLELTDGGQGEASSAWFTNPVNVQSFTTDFTFQFINANSDGMTFTIQNAGITALGPAGGGLGYGAGLPGGTPGIPTSVAVKFDLFQNVHEGNNSTGLYTNGASPTSPSVTLGGNVNLHSGDVLQVHITYDGTTLTMTITDTVTNATFTTSWPINIPATVGGSTALVGFTAGTGLQTITQIVAWTYSVNSSTQQPAATPVISPPTGTFTSPQSVTITDATSGSSIFYTLDGSQPTTSSTPYTGPFTVSSTTTVKAIATAPNFLQSSTATSVITISQSPAATPLISPSTGTYTGPQTVTITDATSGSSIFYTLDGSQPTTSSTQYTGSFTVSSSTTVKAIATAPNFLQSSTATSVITISQAQTSTPLISPVTGTYTSPQMVNITDATSGSSIFYTTDGSQPTTSSTAYTAAFTVTTTTTVKAIATAPNFTTSNTATSVITIQSAAPTINFASGFTSTGLQFNGRTKLNGTRLQLTDGGQAEASSAWFSTAVNVQNFTNDFSFQFINASSDGMTFTIQNAGVTALGPSGGGLGYGAPLPTSPPGIPTSVAVKFDLFQNVHEGNNSTGLYTNGASPTSPSVTLGNGVNLHSGDVLQVHMTYDGTTLTMTITDTVTNAKFTTSWPINIPATVGANTALVGFTAGTGLQTTTQVITWTYGP
jgi:hypothetical protein